MSWRLILPVQACLEVWSWVLISWHASLSPQAISSTPMGSVLFHLQVTHTFVPLAQTLMSNCSLSCFIWTSQCVQSHIHDFPPRLAILVFPSQRVVPPSLLVSKPETPHAPFLTKAHQCYLLNISAVHLLLYIATLVHITVTSPLEHCTGLLTCLSTFTL